MMAAFSTVHRFVGDRNLAEAMLLSGGEQQRLAIARVLLRASARFVSTVFTCLRSTDLGVTGIEVVVAAIVWQFLGRREA